MALSPRFYSWDLFPLSSFFPLPFGRRRDPGKFKFCLFFPPPEFHFFSRRSARPGSGFLFPKSPFPSLPETQIKTKINKSRDPKFSGLSPKFPAPMRRTRPYLEFSSQKMKFHLPEAKITQIFPAGPNIWEGKRKFKGILGSLEVGKTNLGLFFLLTPISSQIHRELRLEQKGSKKGRIWDKINVKIQDTGNKYGQGRENPIEMGFWEWPNIPGLLFLERKIRFFHHFINS